VSTTDGDELEIDLTENVLINKTKNERYNITPVPEFLKDIIESGGLVPYCRKLLGVKT
jgi:3-isopropylmalate/(R)-2-methylmalate dehydratase small subunit